LSWRWVFFINLPITAFAMLVTWRHVDETRVDTAERRIDYVGVAMLSIAIVSILVALDQGPTEGFGDPLITGLLVFGALMLVAFFRVERHEGERALVPSSVLRNRLFAWSCVTVLLMSATFFAALLYLPQFFEKVLGYSPLGSGAGLLPLMGVFAVTSFVAGSLLDRLGRRLVVSTGAAALAIGMFVLSRLDAGSDYVMLVPGMVVFGIGVGLFYSSITTVAVTALDASESSLAGGIIYMCQIAGGAVGLGFNTAIVSSASSLTDGISTAFLVDGFLAAVGFVIVVLVVREDPAARPRIHLRGHQRAHA
jgi:MFS family permease